MKRIATLCFLGICAFVGGFVAQLKPAAFSRAQAPLSVPSRSANVRTVSQARQIERSFETVARDVSRSVVAVEAVKPAEPGARDRRSSEESGSGVIVELKDRKGYFVLTNNHVIENARAERINVNLKDGRILKPVRVWSDPESDVALLKLPATRDLQPAKIGDSAQARVGQWVLAVGSPFGLNQTVTHGIISARGRGQVSLGDTIRIKDFLQTDAAINPGSSGGPLFNLDGEVIGINTAIASNSGSSSGVAFSIPINLVKRVVDDLLEKGHVSRGYLGLKLADTYDANDALRLGLTRAQGAWIETVYRSSPAAVAKLRANDVVLEVNGLVVRNQNHFINLISSLPPGGKARLRVWRNKGVVAVVAVIGDWRKARAQLEGE